MRIKLMAVATMLLLAVAVWAQPAGAPKGGEGGQGRGGGMRGMANIDGEWAALCFDINISAEQLAKLRPSFQWAWQARQKTMKTAMASHDFAAAGKTMAYVSKTIDDRIAIVLTKTQQAQWAKYKADQAALRAQMRAGMGGGGGMGGRPGAGGGQAK